MTALQEAQREKLREVDDGIARWQQAVENAAQQGAIDEELRVRLTSTLRRLADATNDGIAPPFDVHAANEIRRRLLNLLTVDDDERSLDTADRALMEAEAIRHIVRDVLDGRAPQGVSTGAMLTQLQEWLPAVPVTGLAELLGVDRRTVARMRTDASPPSHRLEVLWRLVAVLHRSWTADGVVAWLRRPRTELQGQAPAELLGDPAFEPELLDLAHRGRTQRAG